LNCCRQVLFRQESNFLYLSGFDHEEALLAVGLRSQVPRVVDARHLGRL
jgi:hypothetical protein